jgi:VanZ family protein
MKLESNRRLTEDTLRIVLCILILGGILVAGLWPFHSPTNQVGWLKTENGLQFGEHGTVLSTATFTPPGDPNQHGCSIEIWAEPSVSWDSNTILAFYDPRSHRELALRQSDLDLEVIWRNPGQQARPSGTKLYVDDVLRRGKQVFITVTLGQGQTAAYINGMLARRASEPALSGEDCSGELVVANSPVENDSWSGKLRGLAIYGRELTTAEVLEHYRDWTQVGRPQLIAKDRVFALYEFQEGGGDRIHNQAGSDLDLNIPKRYVVPHEKFLEAPWKEYEPRWSYWEDVLINVGGFIPFGFVFMAYFMASGQVRRPALKAILIGTLVSLAIEILQAFLPTRDSGCTDVVTNTFGTGLGVMLYSLTPAGAVFEWVLSIVSATSARIRPEHLDELRNENLRARRSPLSSDEDALVGTAYGRSSGTSLRNSAE